MTSLSNSVLWQRMHEYYDQLGTEVWEEEVVPHQITSNTYLANIYAKLIVAQIQDYISKHGKPEDSSPFYVVEIGAGHGRFSYYLLTCLQQAFKFFNWPTKWLKYVMTDISQKSLDTWKTHYKLKSFIEAGWLDVAVFDAIKDTELKLTLSGKTLKANEVNKPLVVICNYIFDTLAQDAFQVIDKRLYEVELIITNEDKLNKEDLNNFFNNAKYSFTLHPITNNYYEHYPELNKILQTYEQEVENASFLIPIGAIQCIKNLKRFTQCPLTFLVSDKGISDFNLFEEAEDPDIDLHGAVSMTVNFDALRRYTEHSNGRSLLMGDRGAEFQVAALVYQTDYDIPHTAYAFENSLSTFSPQDLFDICYIDDDLNPAFKTIESIVNLLNLAEWDPAIFYDYSDLLLERIENDEISVAAEYSILNGVQRAWRFFFKLEKSQNLPFAIGAILYGLDFYEKAIEFYKESLTLFALEKETFFNMALAYQALENTPEAKNALKEALKLEPEYQDAKDLLKEIAG